MKLRISTGMIDNLKTRNIALTLTPFSSTYVFKNVGIFVPKGMLIKLTPSNLALSNLALCPKDFVLDSLNHVLFISLHVRAVELVILVKPIGILTRVLMSITFGTKIRTASEGCKDKCDISCFKTINRAST